MSIQAQHHRHRNQEGETARSSIYHAYSASHGLYNFVYFVCIEPSTSLPAIDQTGCHSNLNTVIDLSSAVNDLEENVSAANDIEDCFHFSSTLNLLQKSISLPVDVDCLVHERTELSIVEID
jgi:hypothetical protein